MPFAAKILSGAQNGDQEKETNLEKSMKPRRDENGV